jgi:hypothetical protein
MDNDRFIACSKLACYYYYHYISLHPGDFVRPPSHGIRYLNWRAPDLVDETNTREKNSQRDILNKVIAQIRRDALRQIDQRKGPSAWHPDFTTGITYSKKQNTLVRSALDSKLPSSNYALSNDVGSLNGDSLTNDELLLDNEMPSSLENTFNNLGYSYSNIIRTMLMYSEANLARSSYF